MTQIQRALILSKETFLLQKHLVKAYYMFQLLPFRLRRHLPETIQPSQLFQESNQILNVCQSCPRLLNTPNNLHPVFGNVLCICFLSFLLFHFDVIRQMDGALLGTFFLNKATFFFFKLGHDIMNVNTCEKVTTVGTEVNSQHSKCYMH